MRRRVTCGCECGLCGREGDFAPASSATGNLRPEAPLQGRAEPCTTRLARRTQSGQMYTAGSARRPPAPATPPKVASPQKEQVGAGLPVVVLAVMLRSVH